jgi:tripartite ATP-independent transporter DctP family solute receptor
MKKKGIIRLAMILVLVFAVTACSSPSTPAASGQPATPAAETTTLKLGHIFAQDGSANLAVVKFADLVKEKTNGSYVIEIFPNSQLGDERELCEAVTLGTVDMTLCGDSFINWYVPEYGALTGFFTFQSFAHAERVYHSEVGAELTQAYSDGFNTTVLDYWIRAPRYVCSQKEIRTMADMKGLTLRIPDDMLYFASFQALGANPTPMAFDEIYMGLQRGTISALENPLEDLYNNSFYDVTDYIVETAHQISMFTPMINNDAFQKIPVDVQAIFFEAALEAGRYQNELMAAAEADYKTKLEEKGMTFIRPEDIQDWYAAINTEVPPQFAGVWKDGVLEKALAMAD